MYYEEHSCYYICSNEICRYSLGLQKIGIMGSHLTSRSIHPQSQPCLLLKAGSKARINVNSDS